MRLRTLAVLLAAVLLAGLLVAPTASAGQDARYEIHLSGDPTPERLGELTALCSGVHFVFDEIDVVVASVKSSRLDDLAALDYVSLVAPDGKAYAHHDGILSWDVDMINADTLHLSPATEPFIDGTGVWVAVLDTGLVPNWADYLPAESIALEYAMSFHNPMGNENDGGWRDTDSHGTHVTSTILGYSVYGLYEVEGVAPGVKVVPVKVLNNQGWGWNSCIVAGILYVANLKASGELTGPVVINMSLGSPVPSPAEEAAIDYAIEQGGQLRRGRYGLSRSLPAGDLDRRLGLDRRVDPRSAVLVADEARLVGA